MRTPYNTGKIKMGIYHQTPKYIEQDNDMLTLQSCLIHDPKILRKKRLEKLFYTIFVVFTILVVILV